MREYIAHFSFYDEQWGNFADASYKVDAENPFYARLAAWALCDKDEETRFRSCIKLYAVTWQPNHLDMEDYFNSQAADAKRLLRQIESMNIPNDKINQKERSEYWDKEKCFYFGCLHTINTLAKDLFADKGMAPPSIYEELYYANQLCQQLGYGDQADALWERINQAKKWDFFAIHELLDLFHDGYTTLRGEAALFIEKFVKDGLYPLYADLEDRNDYRYINRWHRVHKVNRLDRLPMLQEEAVIPHSGHHMDFEGQILVMNKVHFMDEYQTAENMLWQASHGNGCNPDAKGRSVWADNVITGEQVAFYRQDFFGVLRPEIYASIDFEALKKDYSLLYGDKGRREENMGAQAGYDDEDSLDDEDEEMEI